MTSLAPRVVIHPDKQVLADAGAARLVTAIVDLQSVQDEVHVALTGGSMCSAILASVRATPGASAIDWSSIHVWWGDERYLPAGDPDRNETQNADALLSHVPLVPEHVHGVAGPDASGSAEESAEDYAAEVRASGHGAFDIMLLGVGPDGHIASLFPHHPAQRTEDAIPVAVHDSPKPPPDRVSLTFECLNRSTRVWFIVAGEDKAEAVAKALAPDADRWDVPASGVKGEVETLWLLDAPAASRLPGE
jgi:6-phosphogluconolactonase